MPLPNSREEFDALFQRLNDENFVRSKHVGELLRVAQESEHFNGACAGFMSHLLQCITPMGFNPEPMRRMVLLMLATGADYQGSTTPTAPDNRIAELANVVCSLATVADVKAVSEYWQERWDTAIANLNIAVIEALTK